MRVKVLTVLFLLFILGAKSQNPFLRIHGCLDKEMYTICDNILDSCAVKNYQPDSVLFYKGLVAIKSGKVEKCRELSRELTKQYPGFGEVHYIKGLIFFAEERYARSADEFTKALQLNPTDIRALFDRSLALGLVEDYKDAVKDLTQCIGLNPNFAKAYYSRAYWQEFLGNFKEAAADYEETVKLEPENYDAYFGLAYAYKILKEEPKACDAINRAVQNGSQIAVDLKANFCK